MRWKYHILKGVGKLYAGNCTQAKIVRKRKLYASAVHTKILRTEKNFQLYRIHCMFESEVFPVLYALLPNKISATHESMFKEIKAHLPSGTHPITVLMDFEKVVINIFTAKFGNSRLQGCFFHLCKAVMRHVQSAGLKAKYENNSDFAHRLRHLAALAFVPVDDVVKVFETLSDANVIPADVAEVFNYFEDTWISRGSAVHINEGGIPQIPYSYVELLQGRTWLHVKNE